MYVILALLLLGVLIIAHEAGHFWAARACGISVQEFSMGMGPLIAKWKSRKGTQFSIRLLPIGGYCQFYGEDEDRPDPRAFNNQAVWKRVDTAFSGPLMNFVIAFLVIALFMSLCGVSVVVPKVAKLEEMRRWPDWRSATKFWLWTVWRQQIPMRLHRRLRIQTAMR